MTRGCGWFPPPKALARKRLAATVSRLAERRKSMVAPVESTARYKYTHLPFTRTYVSSTRPESLVGLSLERKRRSISGRSPSVKWILVRACKATRVAELARDGGGSARRPG